MVKSIKSIKSQDYKTTAKKTIEFKVENKKLIGFVINDNSQDFQKSNKIFSKKVKK